MANEKMGQSVGHSTNLTIGGKSYKSTDVSRLTPQSKEIHTVTGTENTPRDVSKVLKNEAGTIKTNDLDQRPSQTGQAGVTSRLSSTPTTSIASPSLAPVSSAGSPQREERAESTTQLNFVASKAPVQGASLSTAFYTTIAAGQQNSMKSNIDTANIKTASMVEKAKEARAAQAMLQGGYTPTHIIQHAGIEAKASFYEAMGRYNGGGVTLSQNAKNALSTGGTMTVGKAQGAFASHDDMGSQVAGGAIGTGVAAYTGVTTVFKGAQAISPTIINTAKGAWDVSTTAGLATVTLAKTAHFMNAHFIPFNSQFTKSILTQQANLTGVLHTATSRAIINTAQQVQANLISAKATIISTGRGIKTGVVTTTNAVKRTCVLVHGMVNGSIMTSVVAHQALKNAGEIAKKAGLKSLKLAGRGIARGAVKGGIWAYKKGLPNGVKGLGGLSTGLAGILSSSDDMMIKGAGHTLLLSTYGVKTTIVAGRLTGRAVKTSIKGTKAVVKGMSFVRQKGMRAAWAKARSKAGTAIINAGKSIVSAALNLVKGLGMKVIVPLLIIGVGVATTMSLLAAPTIAVSGIFSGIFATDNGDGTFTETDIRTFILDTTFGIPAMRTAYIKDLYDDMQAELKAGGGTRDYVRFKTNTTNDVLEPTIAGIDEVFYSESDLADIIQPIFNAIILRDYDFSPTEAEAKAVLTSLFAKLFHTEYLETIELCGQSGVDGSGDALTAHECGSIHAKTDCPNILTGTHGSATCATCCYEYCSGHSDSDGDTYACSGCEHACRGYEYCGSHNVLTIVLTMDGLYQLLDEYFEEPIEILSNITNRTPEQEKELIDLKDAYEICLLMIGQVARDYGGGLTMEDLSGVTWINGTRVPNQAVIDLALEQVGQVGGQPYWSWYGFSSRVEWCATFVSWCLNQRGYTDLKYASCNREGLPYFKDAGRWANGGYTDLVAGDVIFFDWNGDGKAQHTGLVIGTDGEYVYTVEGNSGDTCKTKRYSINSNVILGYGLMNY